MSGIRLSVQCGPAGSIILSKGSSTNIDVFLEKIFVRLGGGGEGVWALFVLSLQKKISNSIYGRALFEHVVYDLHNVKVNLVSCAYREHSHGKVVRPWQHKPRCTVKLEWQLVTFHEEIELH